MAQGASGPAVTIGDGTVLAGRLATFPPEDPGRLAGTIDVAVVAAGASAPIEVRRDVEAWAGDTRDPSWPVLDFAGRARVIWTPTRVAVLGTAEQASDAVPAAVALAWLAQAVTRMEDEARAIWSRLEGDVPLTHAVGVADLGQQPHVDDMTRRGWRLRTAHVTLTRLGERPGDLPPASLRLYRELMLQAGLSDRLASMEDTIECIQDLYESATDRLTEFSYFRREYRIEVLILLVLVTELAFLGAELFR
ncbi:hypothetical protein [Alsobacter sp. R-9]